MSYDPESWARAEAAVFASLCEATQSQEGRNAFLGDMPAGMFDAWTLSTGGGDARILWSTSAPTDFRINASVDAVFRTRAGAQQFAMLALSILPLRDVENVQCFRPVATGMPTLEVDYRAMANDKAPARRVWVVAMACELVFRTSS